MEPFRVLIVEDDRNLIDMVALALQKSGFSVRKAHDGACGLSEFQAFAPHVVLLDLLMPELDGLELCKRIRRESNAPIIMVTSRDHEMDKIAGLEMGADDYVTKPFSTRELIARIRALLRRTEAAREAIERCDIGELRLDRTRREVFFHDEHITLTATEFELLFCLATHPGRVLTREALTESLYGSTIVSERTLDTFVKRVRRKLREVDRDFDGIETVRAVGYRYRD